MQERNEESKDKKLSRTINLKHWYLLTYHTKFIQTQVRTKMEWKKSL